MRHIDRGDPERAQKPIQVSAQSFAQRGIERGERLVEQENAGPDRDGARQRNTLPLPSGELIDTAIFESLDTGQFDEFGNSRGTF